MFRRGKSPASNEDDAIALRQRARVFEEMLEQLEKQPLVFTLSLHGFIVGQPARLRPLRQALKHCAEHKNKDRVWFTRAGAIADCCFKLSLGVLLGS